MRYQHSFYLFEKSKLFCNFCFLSHSKKSKFKKVKKKAPGNIRLGQLFTKCLKINLFVWSAAHIYTKTHLHIKTHIYSKTHIYTKTHNYTNTHICTKKHIPFFQVQANINFRLVNKIFFIPSQYFFFDTFVQEKVQFVIYNSFLQM